MFSVFLSLILFAQTSSALVTPSGVPSFKVGCVNANPCAIEESAGNPSGWFTIHAGGTITANQFRAFVKSGGSQYQVPAGGIICYHVTYNSAGVSNRFQLASSTAADGITAAALSAGQKYETGAAAAFPHPVIAAQTDYDKAIAYTFDASSYPYAASDTTGVWGITLTCKPN